MEKNDAAKKKRFTVRSLVTALLGSLAPALTVCIFTPLDIVLNNQKEFALPFSELAGIMLLPAVLGFAGLFLLQLLALLLHEKAFRAVNALLLGLSVSFAVQQLFMNGNMTDAQNGSFVGQISAAGRMINCVIHAELILIPPLAVLAVKKKNKAEKETAGFFQRNLSGVLFAGIMLMQGAGFLTSYVQHNPAEMNAEYNKNGSTEQMFAMQPLLSFSPENNIIVFLVDRFDSLFGDSLLEAYPELSTELDGFTFYQNNLSTSVRTFPSVANLLTHVPFDYSDHYLENAWRGDNLLSELRKNGYTVNLLPDCGTTFGGIRNAALFCDNIETLHDTGKTVLKDKTRSILLSFSAARLLPYILKESFNTAISMLANVSYIQYSFDGAGKYSLGYASTKRDSEFYDFVQLEEFRADAGNKVFSFIHLNGAHDDNPELVRKSGITGRDMNIATIRSNFESILMFLHRAKALGVYDKTTFVILGDHGATPNDRFMEELASPMVTALMVKPAGAEHGALQYDRMSALSNDMFSASVLEYAGLGHAEYGSSYQDILKSGEVLPRRIVNIYVRRDKSEETIYVRYEVNGDARDFADWKLIDKTVG